MHLGESLGAPLSPCPVSSSARICHSPLASQLGSQAMKVTSMLGMEGTSREVSGPRLLQAEQVGHKRGGGRGGASSLWRPWGSRPGGHPGLRVPFTRQALLDRDQAGSCAPPAQSLVSWGQRVGGREVDGDTCS